MKQLTVFLSFIAYFFLQSTVSAQVVGTIDESNPGACNGQAGITNPNSLISWSWATSSNVTIQTGGDSLSNLCQGTYILNYTNFLGTQADTFSIGLSSCYGFSASVITTPSTSFNPCNGTLDVVVNGGTAPYTYNWYMPSYGNFVSTTTFFDSLCGMWLSLNVTDANGCYFSTTATVDDPCSSFYTTTSTTNATIGNCDGTATINPIGGTAPYSYSWNNGATTASISNLCPGYYGVEVTDANGCTDSNYLQVVDLCSGLYVVAAGTANTDSVNCTGTVYVNVQGGATPFSYNWSNASTTVFQDSLCNGLYSVVVTDANGCTASSQFQITDSVVGSCTFFVSFDVVPVSNPVLCDGNIYTTPYGLAPYTYQWSNGSTSNNLTNVCAGQYAVTITDANGCVGYGNVVVSDTLPNGPSQLSGWIYTTDETISGACDGTATIYVSGGTPSYSFNGSTSNYLESLCAGDYEILVTDSFGDSLYLSFLIADPGNIIYNYPYADSTILDSLFSGLVDNCEIDYNSINAAYIYNASLAGFDSVTVTWAIFDTNGVNYITETYYFGGGNGVYSLSLSVYCPQKSTGQYLKVFDQLYISDELGLVENVSNGFTAFPNPIGETLSIQFDQLGDYSVHLVDLMGRSIFQTEIQSQQQIQINGLNDLSKGEYLLYITNETGVTVQKLIK